MEWNREPRNKFRYIAAWFLTRAPRPFNEKKPSFFNDLDIHTQTSEVGPRPYNIKTDSKWIINVNVRAKTIRLRRSFVTLDWAMICWLWHQKHKQQRKSRYVGPHRTLKLLCIKCHKEVERQSYEWEETFANQIIYLIRGYYSEYIKHSYNSIPNNLTSKWAKDLN